MLKLNEYSLSGSVGPNESQECFKASDPRGVNRFNYKKDHRFVCKMEVPITELPITYPSL